MIALEEYNKENQFVDVISWMRSHDNSVSSNHPLALEELPILLNKATSRQDLMKSNEIR
jgi:hypothetical protein